ncbi:hypothetical protein BOTBODRAFT_90682, partial [Botryobasidium botryosum FD-172 SS1]
LDELLRMEASAEHGKLCSCSRDVAATIRCLECHPDRLQCAQCALESHSSLPLHRTERWQDNHFVAAPLIDFGLMYHLSHDGARCPSWKDGDKNPDGHIIQVAHVNGFHAVRIGFCRCLNAPSHATQLLRMRMFPGTLSKPRTAYTISLLVTFHTLTRESNLNTYDYAKALARFTDQYSPYDIKTRYDNFRIVVRFWRDLQMKLRSGQHVGLLAELPPVHQGSIALLCPACPQPDANATSSSDGAPGSDNHQRTLYLSMDANFRAQQKDKTNDPADFHLHPGGAYFREDSAFREYLAAVGDEHEVCCTTACASTCSGFKALNVLRAGRYKNTLVSGILSVMCARHSFFRPNGTVDLQKGERYTHADYALAGALAG